MSSVCKLADEAGKLGYKDENTSGWGALRWY